MEMGSVPTIHNTAFVLKGEGGREKKLVFGGFSFMSCSVAVFVDCGPSESVLKTQISSALSCFLGPPDSILPRSS